MKKLSQGFLIQSFAFASLFMAPFTQFINGGLWILCALLFVGLTIWFMLITEYAKKELAIPGGRFQPLYKKIGYGTATAALIVVFGACFVFLVAGMIEIVTALGSSSSANLIMPLFDFLKDNYKWGYCVLFAALLGGLALIMFNEYRILRYMRKLGGKRKIGFRALQISWFAACAARVIGLIHYIYILNFVLIKQHPLPEEYWKNLWIYGIVFALQLLFVTFIMRTDERLDPNLPELDEDYDEIEDFVVEDFLPKEDKG